MPRTVTFPAAVVVTLWCVVCALMADACATPLERVEFESASPTTQRHISGGLILGDHMQGYLAKPEAAEPIFGRWTEYNEEAATDATGRMELLKRHLN